MSHPFEVLTQRAEETWRYICTTALETGFKPTFRAARFALGISHHTTYHTIRPELVRKGYVKLVGPVGAGGQHYTIMVWPRSEVRLVHKDVRLREEVHRAIHDLTAKHPGGPTFAPAMMVEGVAHVVMTWRGLETPLRIDLRDSWLAPRQDVYRIAFEAIESASLEVRMGWAVDRASV